MEGEPAPHVGRCACPPVFTFDAAEQDRGNRGVRSDHLGRACGPQRLGQRLVVEPVDDMPARVGPPNHVCRRPLFEKRVHVRGDEPLAMDWHAPPDMPPTGRISHVSLPGQRSRFPARPAWLYLPPAYLASPRARCPCWC